ncbi:hypothetical protein [Leptospira kmetyi]|uniref:hypothetical protein n=1 Tax=Leptospira kmetyi TaxID=408139 RepID=UPI001083A6B3|nr:hypothetical protein [Leptospira kmetyi]TGK17712.1 hypothetical protein EHO62_08490 [Leptospira kmetyi]TGK25028.1 hypothetical protein EHO66_19445 [Leptospira kmetyi]
MKLVKQIGVCLVLISLLSACKKDEKDDSATNLALLLALSGGSTCTVTAGGVTLPVASVSPAKLTVASLFFTTAAGLGLGTIQLSNVVVNDFGSFTVNSGTISSLTIYKGTCPLTVTSTTAVLNTDYSITSGSLTNITSTTNIKFLTPGSYVILAQTSNGAQATVQYGQ